MSDAHPKTPCPYCRSPVEDVADAKECPSCGASHHNDCWSENGGCAVVGCSSGPQPAGGQGVVLPPIEEPEPSVVVDVEEAAEEETPASGRRAVTAIAILAVVAMVAIGVGAAIVVRDANRGGSVETVGGGAGETDSTTGAAPASAISTRQSRPPGPQGFTQAEAERGAAKALLRHHELLAQADGDPDSPAARRAFELLSDRKRQAEAEDAEPGQSGFEYWLSKREYENLSIGRAVCLPGSAEIRPPGYWRPQAGEAMIYLDYGSYAGFTWALFEHGRWTYDAGYGHVESREDGWRSREHLLFQATGVSC